MSTKDRNSVGTDEKVTN